MTSGRHSRQQLPVERAVLYLRRRQLSVEETQRPPPPSRHPLLQNTTNMVVTGVGCQRQFCPLLWMGQARGRFQITSGSPVMQLTKSVTEMLTRARTENNYISQILYRTSTVAKVKRIFITPHHSRTGLLHFCLNHKTGCVCRRYFFSIWLASLVLSEFKSKDLLCLDFKVCSV